MSCRQHGLGMIAAIIILVILASLAGAIASFSTTQHTTSAQDVLATRAWQAAKSGNEWGLYQALKADNCGQQTLDLSVDTGFWVKVSCAQKSYTEGESSMVFYTITAVACNRPTCPVADASSVNYVERTRIVIAGK